MPKTEPITIGMDSIESEFELVSYRWFDGKWCPAVFEKDGGYEIRILAGRSYRGRDVIDRYDYFELNAEGVIVKSPRGYAKAYNKLRVRDIADAVAKFAIEDPAVLPMRF